MTATHVRNLPGTVQFGLEGEMPALVLPLVPKVSPQDLSSGLGSYK